MSNIVERMKSRQKTVKFLLIVYVLAVPLNVGLYLWRWHPVNLVVGALMALLAVFYYFEWKKVTAMLNSPLLYIVALRDEFGPH